MEWGHYGWPLGLSHGAKAHGRSCEPWSQAWPVWQVHAQLDPSSAVPGPRLPAECAVGEGCGGRSLHGAEVSTSWRILPATMLGAHPSPEGSVYPRTGPPCSQPTGMIWSGDLYSLPPSAVEEATPRLDC